MGFTTRLTSEAKLGLERARARFGLVDVVVSTIRRHSDDDGAVRAAALTYYMFFSIFPLLLFAASALGYAAFLSEGFRERLLTAGLEAFPLLDSLLSGPALRLIEERRGTFALTGVALALYSGSGGVVALQHSTTSTGSES